MFKHGHSRRSGSSRTYRIWRGMINRCHNERSPHWKKYGARGISVCKRWRESFPAFLEDMGEAAEGLSIDRMHPTDNYMPGRCRWSTPTEQSRNTRRNRWITIGDRTEPLAVWVLESGLSHKTITSRLDLGWTAHDAVFLPAARGNNQFTRSRQ